MDNPVMINYNCSFFYQQKWSKWLVTEEIRFRNQWLVGMQSTIGELSCCFYPKGAKSIELYADVKEVNIAALNEEPGYENVKCHKQ